MQEWIQSMNRQYASTILSRCVRLFLAVAGVTLVALALSGSPAHADGDDPSGAAEMRLTRPLLLHALADPASPVVTTLSPGTVIVGLSWQKGADGTVWVRVGALDRTPLGWTPRGDFLSARLENPTTGALHGISTLP